MAARKPALWFAVFVVLIDALGMSIIIPIMPDLLEELTGRPVAETAVIGGFLTAVYALNQFLFGPMVGALSDRYGRRPVILFAMFALTLDYLLMAVSWSVWVLFLGRFLAGLSGASYTVATAYIADISEKKDRAANFGLVGAAFGLGFVFGPALGGIAAEFGVRAPLYLSAGLAGLGVIFGVFFLPESLREENTRDFNLRAANPFSSLQRAFALPGVGLLILAHTLISLSDWVYPAIWAYWGTETFGWTPRMIAITLTVYGLSAAAVQGGLIRIVIPAIGEVRAIFVGMGFSIVSLSLLAFASATWMVICIIMIAALAHITGAALSGLMANRVGDNVQGELQGVLGALGAVSSVVTSLVATSVFFTFSKADAPIYFPGAPFLLSALLSVAALIPLYIELVRRRAIAGNGPRKAE